MLPSPPSPILQLLPLPLVVSVVHADLVWFDVVLSGYLPLPLNRWLHDLLLPSPMLVVVWHCQNACCLSLSPLPPTLIMPQPPLVIQSLWIFSLIVVFVVIFAHHYDIAVMTTMTATVRFDCCILVFVFL